MGNDYFVWLQVVEEADIFVGLGRRGQTERTKEQRKEETFEIYLRRLSRPEEDEKPCEILVRLFERRRA